MTLPDNYDPSDEAKQWYRNTTDGQLGWFVKRDGVAKIKLDRPGNREILKPFSKGDWQLCEDKRQLTPYQIGEVSFQADLVICRILGKYERSMMDWKNMSHAAKMEWITNGPKDDPERIKLYRTIKEIMSSNSEKNSTKNTY